MALIIDATAAGSTSNSYATLAEATTYFESRLNSTDWIETIDSDKNKALVMACRRIESCNFKGSKYKTGYLGADNYQALQWPRYPKANDPYLLGIPWLTLNTKYADWVNSSLIPIIPIKLKYAQFEQALFIVRHYAGSDKRAEIRAQGLSSFSVGGAISETYNSSIRIIENAMRYLLELDCLESAQKIERG